MIKHVLYGVVSVAILALTACATSTSLYYWGDYSQSAYELKHEPSEKTARAHKDALLDIIDNAARKNKKIPPGIYAELAKMAFEANNLVGGRALLEQEKALFPESARMVEVWLELMDKKGAVNEATG
ncbi:MAG: hypothetical protein ACJA13_003008 [Paraglaciecola sp.]|jgi:hypothetical protein